MVSSVQPCAISRLASNLILSAALVLFGANTAYCCPVVACAAHSLSDTVCSMCISPVNLWCWSRSRETDKMVIRGTPPPTNPFAPPTYTVPCGKCVCCLEAKRRDWIRRIQCESWLHSESSFITLTYSDQFLPADGLVSKPDIQNFVKRFRNIPRDFGIPFDDFKYFIVSEYGKLKHRPHYHGILFGVDLKSSVFQSRFACLDSKGYPLFTSVILEKVWGKGFVTVDRVTPSTIAYVTKYVTKGCEGCFRLFSRGLGKKFFFDSDNVLRPFARDSFLNGFVCYPSSNGSFRGPIPKNIDRYLSLYYPMFSEDIKSRRREFALSKPCLSQSLSDVSDAVVIRNQREDIQRKLDNES